MWTRLKTSLTLRIFCITSALLIAACGITYGAVIYLTPISYTSLLADELSRETDTLIARLGEAKPDECEKLLIDFVRQTGADMRLTLSDGTVLYDTIPAETYAFSGDVTMESADVGSVVEGSDASTVEQVIESVLVTDNTASSDNGTAFTFADGTNAALLVQGGMKAVNQAAEAMKQILPFLLVVVMGISLLGSFFYARFITKPIVSISQLAKRIAALDFGARWREQRLDEIGALGSSLNLLSDNLSGALSELQAANQTLQRDIERERALDQQRLAFFSAASHELKTPVTILKGQLSGMLAQVGVYRDREKYLARALEVTGRMEGLIKEILTISRIESGSFSLSAAPLDLGELMEKQLVLDTELMEQKQLRLETKIASGVLIRGNENLLANAIDNVLMNAILYSPAEATLRVRVGNHSFSVENTGVSIPGAALSDLFTPFYRVEQSRNRKTGGSGLGLYLVKSILKLHDADCQMENTPEGVRFTARFP